MNQQQFHDRLIKLIEYAHRDDLCPACVLRDLLTISKSIVATAHLPADVLDAHGINNIEFASSNRDAHTPPRTLQ